MGVGSSPRSRKEGVWAARFGGGEAGGAARLAGLFGSGGPILFFSRDAPRHADETAAAIDGLRTTRRRQSQFMAVSGRGGGANGVVRWSVLAHFSRCRPSICDRARDGEWGPHNGGARFRPNERRRRCAPNTHCGGGPSWNQPESVTISARHVQRGGGSCHPRARGGCPLRCRWRHIFWSPDLSVAIFAASQGGVVRASRRTAVARFFLGRKRHPQTRSLRILTTWTSRGAVRCWDWSVRPTPLWTSPWQSHTRQRLERGECGMVPPEPHTQGGG